MQGWEVRPRDCRRERRLRRLVILLVLLLPLAFWAGLQARQLGSADDGGAEDASLDELRQRLVVMASAEDVARQADERNRKTIKLLEEQIFRLQQDLAFYKGVLAPASLHEGLRISSFELRRSERPGRFRFKIMLGRVGPDDQLLAGELKVWIEGERAGERTRLALDELLETADARLLRFEFKHFQAIPEGGRFAELALPENFVPAQIVVRAQVPGEPVMERVFKWIDLE